ncbi:hypothetical protein GYMLUDRAFT_170352, partial [Collybiopsis luxurians FD-317 M1]
GMHIAEIAERCAVDVRKLEHILHLLCLRHVFKEGPPQVFANNHLSEALDTGKSIIELQKEPNNKHNRTSGKTAMFEIRAEGSKFSSFLLEGLTNPRMKSSHEPNQTVFQYVMGTEMTFWEYIAQPEMDYMCHRFNIVMKGWDVDPDVTILKALDWCSLNKGAKVVDIGGGVGSAMAPLAREFPHLQIIVQDLPGVIIDATKVWNDQLPNMVKTAQVIFQSSNFFESQPIEDASVFYLRRVLHDWSNKYAKSILQILCKVIMPHSRLVVAEHLLHPACIDPLHDTGEGISGYKYNCAPEPLLPNFGVAHELAYMTDYELFSGQDRTLTAMDDLLQDSGWHITYVRL